MFHAVNHSLTKAMLFLVAGNLLAVYNSKSCRDVRGALQVVPVSAALWVAGFLAITGSPPFGPFLSEFTVLKAALDQGHAVVAVLYLAFLGIIFVGMTSVLLRMTQGQASLPADQPRAAEHLLSVIPPAVLGVLTLCLGVYVPAPLNDLLHHAAQLVGGS